MSGTNQSQPRLTFSPEAAKYAEDHHLDLDDLEEMVLESAIVSHPDGNRRFEGFVFRVKGTEVLAIAPFAPDFTSPFSTALAPGEFIVTEDCEDCNGAGCPHCGGSGAVSTVRTSS